MLGTILYLDTSPNYFVRILLLKLGRSVWKVCLDTVSWRYQGSAGASEKLINFFWQLMRNKIRDIFILQSRVRKYIRCWQNIAVILFTQPSRGKNIYECLLLGIFKMNVTSNFLVYCRSLYYKKKHSLIVWLKSGAHQRCKLFLPHLPSLVGGIIMFLFKLT